MSETPANPESTRSPFRRLFNSLKENLHGKENPNIKFSAEVERTLIEIINVQNSDLSTLPFIGLGHDGVVEDLYYPPEGFSLSSAPSINGRSMEFATDTDQYKRLIEAIAMEGRLSQILFVGRTNPSGVLDNGVQKLVKKPRMALLDATTRDAGAIRGTSITINDTPVNIPYEAIAANTEHGPAIRIYDATRLGDATSQRDIRNTPSQTIFLKKG